MAWRRPGEKPLSEPTMVSLPKHICVIRPQWINMQIPAYQYRNSNHKYKTVSWPSYLYNGNPYLERLSLYWNGTLIPKSSVIPISTACARPDNTWLKCDIVLTEMGKFQSVLSFSACKFRFHSVCGCGHNFWGSKYNVHSFTDAGHVHKKWTWWNRLILKFLFGYHGNHSLGLLNDDSQHFLRWTHSMLTDLTENLDPWKQKYNRIHTCAVFCFLWLHYRFLVDLLIYRYSSRLLHRYLGNRMVNTLPVKLPWRIRVKSIGTQALKAKISYDSDIFVWNFKWYLLKFTQSILPMHWNMCILFRCENLRTLRFFVVVIFKRYPDPVVKCFSVIWFQRQWYHSVHRIPAVILNYWHAILLFEIQ